jgi:hypothetical protein
MKMSMNVREVFAFLAYTVPGVMVLGGLCLTVLGYPLSQADITGAGWVLIVLGCTVYLLELLIVLVRHYSSDYTQPSVCIRARV